MLISELKAKLKSEDPAGWYLFCGEENFLKRHYLRELRAALLPDPTFDAFNHILLEGERLDFGALLDAIKAPPMMAERKLVEWHLCDFSAMREGDLQKLHDLCEAGRDYPETAVCFVADADRLDVGSLPKRPSKLYSALAKDLSVVVFERSNENALAAWLDRHFRHEEVAASPAVIRALLSQSGTDMDALSGEVAKLCAYARANGKDALSEADVARVASRVEDFDAFALSDAILSGNADRAYACLRDMRLRKVEPAIAVSSVTKLYSDLLSVGEMAEEGLHAADIGALFVPKMHEYRVSLYMRAAAARGLPHLRETIDACLAADRAVKSGSSAAESYLALELLVARIL